MRHAWRMTTWQSLLYCAAADVTLERVRNLVAVTGTEPLTVEFKEGGSTPAVAVCAAAMANLHGGLILIGVTDQDRRIVGVPRETMAHVADVLATHLESPDWQPEMVEVPLDDGSDRYVLVLRVNPDTAPRPVFPHLTARFSKRSGPSSGPRSGCPDPPVRRPARSCALFVEQRPAQPPEALWNLEAPRIPHAKDGTDDPAVDFALRSGLIVPAGPAAWGRPISERALGELAGALNRSALTEVLFSLTRFAGTGIETFHPEGSANRSNTAALIWRLEPHEPVAFSHASQPPDRALERRPGGHGAPAEAGSRRMGGAVRCGSGNLDQSRRGQAGRRSGRHRSDHGAATERASCRQRAPAA